MRNSPVYLGGMSIATINMSKMVRFYEAVFRTRFNPLDIGKYILYKGTVGNIHITLTPNEFMGVRAAQSKYHLSFVVPNLEEHLRLAMMAGGKQTQDIDMDQGEKYCELVDPDGNPLELIELVTENAY